MKTFKSALSPYMLIKPVSGNIMRRKVLKYLDKREKRNSNRIGLIFRDRRKPLASDKISRKKVHQEWYIPSFIKRHK